MYVPKEGSIRFYDLCLACGYSDTAQHIKFSIFHEEDETHTGEMDAHFHNIINYAEYIVECITPRDNGILEIIIKNPEVKTC